MGTHCAKFSDALLPVAATMLKSVGAYFVLDPFAGTGKGVDYFADECGFEAWGIELEPEFITSPRVSQGDALHPPWPYNVWPRDNVPVSWDAIFTSPTYGNRMADKDMRPSVAGTYAKSLGRHASEGSSCHLQWGEAYRHFHVRAWKAVHGVLKPGGHLLLNISDHVRAGKLVPVTDWHLSACGEIGFERVRALNIPTPRLRRGANAEARAAGEWLLLLRKAA